MMPSMNHFSLHTVLSLFLLGAVSLSGCGKPPESAGGDGQSRSYPYAVTTTTGMITDIVRQVAGDKAEVSGLIASGIDPHGYTPKRGDVVQLSASDIVFYNGLMLEGKMADVLVKVAQSGKPVHAVTEMLDDESYVLTTEEDYYDPHVWMDVQGWMAAVRVVAAKLAAFDPANAEFYHANAEAYIAQLEQLNAYAQQAIATIPDDQRVLITAHDAFGYFGRAYGIEVRGIQGISTESEAGVRDINQLISFIVERNIGAVFVETSVADKNVRALVEGAQSRNHELKIGGSLFSDAMGKPGTYEGTYIGMIDHNVTTITRALGGEAPEGGFQAWLKTR